MDQIVVVLAADKEWESDLESRVLMQIIQLLYYWAFAHLSTRYDDTAENETKATADAEHVFGLDQQSERRSWFERCERGGSRAVNKVDAIQLAWDNADRKAQCASCIHII